QELRSQCQGQAGDERPRPPKHPMKPRGFMGTPGTCTCEVDECDGSQRRVLDAYQAEQSAEKPEREPAGRAAALAPPPPDQHERADGEGGERVRVAGIVEHVKRERGGKHGDAGRSQGRVSRTGGSRSQARAQGKRQEPVEQRSNGERRDEAASKL